MTNLKDVLLLAQETGEHGAEEADPLELILPAIPELVWGTISFLVVLLVLSKVAFPKLRESVEAREKKIADDLEAAERAKTEAQREQERYRSQIAAARTEGGRLIEEARGQAEQVRKEIIAKAERDAEGVVARAQEQIEAERVRTLQELQGQVAELSIQLAEKVVGRALDGGVQRELVESYIQEVASMRGAGNGAARSSP